MLSLIESQKYQDLQRKIASYCFFPKITELNYKYDYLIEVKFDDNRINIIDFSSIIEKNSTGLFADLNNIEYFCKAAFDKSQNAITWPNNVGFSAIYLYSLTSG